MRLFNTTNIKTFAKTIVVLMAVFVVVLGPVSLNYVHAQGAPPATPPPKTGFTPPAIQAIGRAWDTVGGTEIVNIAGNVIIEKIVELITFLNGGMILAIQWAAEIFQGALEFADTPLREVAAITAGWTIVRDISNIFLIFILLIIAIATILRIESYGARALLVRLILVALLINFSLVTAQVVVDTSNILGRTFIAKITPVKDKLAATLFLGKLTSPANTLPANFVGPVQPANNVNQRVQSLARPIYGEDMAKLLARALSNGGTNPQNNLTARFFLQVLIFVLLFLAFFVFLALAGLYIIRAAALILIFVFAPFGFLFLALPATRGMAMKWWNNLFQWSFFFPASAFLIYLSIMWGSQVAALQIQGTQFTTTALAFHYFIMIVMLLGSIVVAKSMGAVGAGAVIGLGIAARKMAVGYVGRGGVRAAGFATKPVAAGLGALGTIPVVGGAFRIANKPFAWIQREADRAKKKSQESYKDLSDSALKATYQSMVTPGAKRQFRETMAKQGKSYLFSEKEREADYERFEREGKVELLRQLEATDPTVVSASKAVKEGRVTLEDAVRQAMARMSPKNLEEKFEKAGLNKPAVQTGILLGLGARQMEAMIQRQGADAAEAAKKGFAILKTNYGGVSGALDHFKKTNREGLKALLANPGVGVAFADVKSEVEAEIGTRGMTIDDFIKQL